MCADEADARQPQHGRAHDLVPADHEHDVRPNRFEDLRSFRLIDPRDLMQRHAVLGAERRVVDAARTLGGELGGERQHRGDRGPRRQQCLQCRQAFGVKTNPRKFHRR